MVDGGEAQSDAFEGRDEAARRVIELLTAAEAGGWLDVGDRHIRPGAVVSIDVIESDLPAWGGSASRQRWAQDD